MLISILIFSGNPNPFAVLFKVDEATRNLTKIATTDVRNDSTDPSWPSFITVDYNFERIEEVSQYIDDGFRLLLTYLNVLCAVCGKSLPPPRRCGLD